MNNENILYLIIYTPLLASILSNFFNKTLNKFCIYFILFFMLILSAFTLKIGKINLFYQDKKYLFDNNLYSNIINIVILVIFLIVKIAFRIKDNNSNNNLDYPIYYMGIFSFTIFCASINFYNSITFFIIYLISEYQTKKNSII